MIISRKIKTKNDNYKIFQAVKIAFAKLKSNIKNANGQLRKYSKRVNSCLYAIWC